jgi:hypothetical protein
MYWSSNLKNVQQRSEGREKWITHPENRRLPLVWTAIR